MNRKKLGRKQSPPKKGNISTSATGNEVNYQTLRVVGATAEFKTRHYLHIRLELVSINYFTVTQI
jgi:hypothetical protein